MHEPTTEDRILQAAAGLWHEGGFDAVTTRAVAARAGVNEVTLFRHFASKEGLLKALVARAVAGLGPAADDRFDATADLEADLRRWAQAYLAQTLPIGDLILLGIVKARGQPELATACLAAPAELCGALTARLEALCRAGGVPPGPFEAIAEAFYATLFAHVLTAHLRARDPETVARRVASVFARALGAGEAAALDGNGPVPYPASGGAPGARRA